MKNMNIEMCVHIKHILYIDWVQRSNTISEVGKSLEACRTTFLQGGMPSDFTSLFNPLVPWVD